MALPVSPRSRARKGSRGLTAVAATLAAMEKVTDARMAKYEGLVTKTASLNVKQLRMEFEELRQELRLAVLKALQAYDANKHKLSEERFVFGCMTNYLMSLRREAGAMKRTNFTTISLDWGTDGEQALSSSWTEGARGRIEVEALRFNPDLSPLEDDSELPVDLTDEEKAVLVMLIERMSHQEIADRLKIQKGEVVVHAKNLRTKLAYLRNDVSGVVAA